MDYGNKMIELRKDEIRRKIAEGVESAKGGRLSNGEEFMTQILAELDEEVMLEEEQATEETVVAK